MPLEEHPRADGEREDFLRNLEELERLLAPLLEKLFSEASKSSKEGQSGLDFYSDPLGALLTLEKIDDEIIIGETNICASEQWSPSYLHGSDILHAGSLLLEKLLVGGEKIISTNVRWHYPALNQLALVASIKQNPLGVLDRDLQMTSSFTTSQGRTIYLYAFPNNQAVKQIASANPISRRMLPRDTHGIYDTETSHYVIPLRDPGEEMRERLQNARLPLQLSTYLDIIGWGTAVLNDENLLGETANTAFIGEFRNLQLPSPIELASPRSRLLLKARSDKRKETENGFLLVPISVQFLGEGDVFRYCGECTLAFTPDVAAAERYIVQCKRRIDRNL